MGNFNNYKQKSNIPKGILFGILFGIVLRNLIVGVLMGILAAVVLDSKNRENNSKPYILHNIHYAKLKYIKKPL